MKHFKIIVALVLTLTVIFAMAGCGNAQAGTDSGTKASSQEESTQEQTSQEVAEAGSLSTSKPSESVAEPGADTSEDASQAKEEPTPSGSNILVVYFSRTGEQYGVGVIDEGNTAIVAKMVAEKTGADTFEILPVDDHYPMTYDELTDVAKQEQNEKARPEYITEGLPDLSQYSTIFIGAPVWWGDWPMICYTFFENEDLSGKTLYPFSTHAGSGLSGFDKKLSSAVPGSTVGKGLAIAGTDCQNNQDNVKSKVNDWLAGLEY